MKLKGGFSGLHDAFMAQEQGVVRDKVGNARYGMDDNMRPTGSAVVQSPAQKMAVKKAAAASARNRRIRAGLPLLPVK